jgi:hypothetical protein
MKRIALCLALLASCSRNGFIDSNGETGVKDIDAAGGDVRAKNVSLHIPANALASTVRITIDPATGTSPEGNIGAAYELGPTGTQFSQPIELQLKVDPTALPDPAHPELARVAVAVGDEWEPLADSEFDAANGVVRGTTTHFSRYGVIQICGNFRKCTAPTNSRCVKYRCVPTEICDNGIDDDHDGLVDCADGDCAASTACQSTCCFDTIANQCVTACCSNGLCQGNCYCGTGFCSRCASGGTETVCNDSIDNDHDGFVDCKDPDCASNSACAVKKEICNNGIDDDADGSTDCLDSDCGSDPSCPMCCFVTISNSCVNSCCQNGLCQGNCYCSASLCQSCGAKKEDCANSLDDDGDGKVDCYDSDCATDPACSATPTSETNCTDGVDNDRDGVADCQDSDCQGGTLCSCTNTTGCCYPTCGPNEQLECLGANICGYPCSCKPAASDAGSAGPTWFYTCGDPVCRGHTITSVPKCNSGDVAGSACSTPGAQCDPDDGCNRLLQCDTMDPTHGGVCPISRAKYKEDIHFIEPNEMQRYHDELMQLPLATYKYKDARPGERQHLGFIIDGHESMICVQPERDQIDVYGYASMAVAALKVQAQQIEQLQLQLKSLEQKCAAKK